MRNILSAASMLAVTAGTASAGGLDRSGQALYALFEPGRNIEFVIGRVQPDVSGTDLRLGPFPGGGNSGDVANDYTQFAFTYKADINDQWSYAIIYDQPFGADVLYGPGSFNLGGTKAYAETDALTGLLRYKFGNGFSAHAGVKAQRASGDIDLRGAAYGPVNGYSVELSDDTAFGYVVGVAYEKPEIALRVVLSYSSKITHEFDTVETLRNGAAIVGTSPTETSTPQSVNLDFQTGVAPGWLVFGQIRWVDWSEFKIDPAWFTPATGGGLVSLEDTTTYVLGVGHKFSDTWSGAFSVTYEGTTGRLVSPLAPSDGKMGATISAIYTADNFRITTGINYTEVGDALPETGTPDTARADFKDNYAWGAGVRIVYSF